MMMKIIDLVVYLMINIELNVLIKVNVYHHYILFMIVQNMKINIIIKFHFISFVMVLKNIFSKIQMVKLIQMNLNVIIGHVIISIHDVTVSGHVQMDKMKIIVIMASYVLLEHIHVYLQ